MAKKLSLLLTAVALLASAIPPSASAATGLTQGGALVATSQTLVLKNPTLTTVKVTSTKTGNVACESVTFQSPLVVNSTSEVRTFGGSGVINRCEVIFGLPVSASSVVVTEFKTIGFSTVTAALSFSILFSGGIECHYTMTSGSFSYNAGETSEGGNVLTASEVPLSVTPAACGTTAKLDGTFSMTRQTGGGKVFLM